MLKQTWVHLDISDKIDEILLTSEFEALFRAEVIKKFGYKNLTLICKLGHFKTNETYYEQ